MKIHIVKQGENTADIAKKYGISERILKIANEIDEKCNIIEGEELLILTPTRTYTAKAGDDLVRVALRFGQPAGALRGLNPHIITDQIPEGETVIVKFDERPYGMGTANGVYYKGCPKWKLMRALPFLTYLTVGSRIFDGKKLSSTFNTGEIVGMATEAGKVPLLRVYDKSNGEIYYDKNTRDEYINRLIQAALEEGYRGLTLAGENYDNEGYEEFLVELRGKMIGNDMILMSEVTPESPIGISDFSDGAILSCDGICDEDAIINFAKDGESTKTLIEIPVFAFCENGSVMETRDAIDIAKRTNTPICHDITTNKSIFYNKKCGRIRFDSLSYIKSRMDNLANLGYMGISFDIGRTPLSYLMMYDALFKSVGYANVDKRVKCNPYTAKNQHIEENSYITEGSMR